MKFDAKSINKEFLLKHRFWILLGASVFLTLVGMFYLEIYVDADADRKLIEDPLKNKKGIAGPQSAVTIKARQDLANEAQQKESIVWNEAYKAQESMFRWSNRIEEEFDFLQGKFATEITVGGPLIEAKMWPEDTSGLMHGELTKLEANSFTLKNRKGAAIRFHLAVGANNVTVQGQKETLQFARMDAAAVKKLVIVKYQTGRYFNDPLTVAEQRTFAETYKTQIHPLLQEINPLDDKGEGVVQLRNWLFQPDSWPSADKKFLRYVTADWDLANDISKEAWIAQENLWIQKEIYEILRSANDSLSSFEAADKKNPKAGKNDFWETRNKAYSFRNQYFELILNLHDKGELSFTIKNLQAKRQKLDGLNFRVQTNKNFPAEIINISSYPLEPKGDKNGKDTYVQSIPKKDVERKGIYGVEQVLTWETAAVKRLDVISIGCDTANECSHSQRTYPEGLVALEPEEKKDTKGPGGPGGRPMSGVGGIGGIGGGGGGGGGGGLLPHGLWKARYVEVTEQSRRIPVCVVVIVDQAHVDRVLTAFNTKSRLRFLQTQVLWNQYGDSLQPPMALADKLDPGGAAPRFNPPMGPGPMGPRKKQPLGPQTRPGGGGAPGGVSGGGGSQAFDTNIELAIYGIMTLYQRYPPRPTTAKK